MEKGIIMAEDQAK